MSGPEAGPARGRLIVLEGGEGAGKTTQARRIAEWLRSRGREVVLTREPGGSLLAEAIRAIVLRDWAEGIDAPTEALLIFAARAAHLHATIRPALARGADVVCDRFVDASWAYQGAGRGLADEHLHALERLTLAGLEPDLTLLFDIPPDQGLERAARRGESNRFEAESAAFRSRVRQAYLSRAASRPAHYQVIDARPAADEVWTSVRDVLEERL